MTPDDLKRAAKDTSGRAADASEDVTASVKATAAKVGENVREFASRTGDAVGGAYGDARDRIRDAREHLPDGSEALAASRRAYEQGNRVVGRHVGKQPLEALLLAGAIGYLVGWATNRG